MFKEKSGKKRLPSTETSKEVTLDARHQQFVDNVVDKCATLEAKRAERELALLNLTEWRQVMHETAQGGGLGAGNSNGTENKGGYNMAWSSNVYWNDQYQPLNKVIQRLESAEEEIEYYENTEHAVLASTVGQCVSRHFRGPHMSGGGAIHKVHVETEVLEL
jgi:hypothetical protein